MRAATHIRLFPQERVELRASTHEFLRGQLHPGAQGARGVRNSRTGHVNETIPPPLSPAYHPQPRLQLLPTLVYEGGRAVAHEFAGRAHGQTGHPLRKLRAKWGTEGIRELDQAVGSPPSRIPAVPVPLRT